MKVLRSDGLAARRAALRILQQVRDGRPFDAALASAVTRLPEDDRTSAVEAISPSLAQAA